MKKILKVRVKRQAKMSNEYAEEVLRGGKTLICFKTTDAMGNVFQVYNVENNKKLYFVVTVTTRGGSCKILECTRL